MVSTRAKSNSTAVSPSNPSAAATAKPPMNHHSPPISDTLHMSKEDVDVETIDFTSPDVASTDADQDTHEPGNHAEARDDPKTNESQRVEPSQDSPPGAPRPWLTSPTFQRPLTSALESQGATLELRITTTGVKGKSTILVPFQLTLPRALDGFYMDIPSGVQNLFEERLLFESLQRLEPRFLLGMYTSVSATTGMSGSRYRIHFLGSDIPSTMLLDGRMVEEFIFRVRCLRVYGQSRPGNHPKVPNCCVEERREDSAGQCQSTQSCYNRIPSVARREWYRHG
ncbi:Aste57867_25370 [Aphanomyces stellatus]|uniref:Aste57867_25370 protein n=1 Tax=Aphanomyces stellatus TaxID=120398 RepID=A0A485LT05_9STRA|nr:hypothetical protein As57867_025292 [Aphanomyces stellatus]VFU01995.1 Aste57867_25370 [Aphanomyces stellatus]